MTECIGAAHQYVRAASLRMESRSESSAKAVQRWYICLKSRYVYIHVCMYIHTYRIVDAYKLCIRIHSGTLSSMNAVRDRNLLQRVVS